MKFKLPVLTLALVGAALLVYGWPLLAEVLVYDRHAIRAGDWWRLFTAPLVHFSASHLGWNLTVLAAAGWAVGAAAYRHLWLVYGLACFLPGPIYLLTAPDLLVYGGLSGAASGAMAYLCLRRALQPRKDRPIWLVLLVLMGLKVLAEAVWKTPVFVQGDGAPFRVLPSVHVVGCLAAATVALCARYVENLRSAPQDLS